MPIRPENLHHYRGQAWKAVRAQILERAGNRCEGSPAYPDCRAQNGQAHPETGSKVVLTIAHLDHNPANNAPENLRAWCQRCHNSMSSIPPEVLDYLAQPANRGCVFLPTKTLDEKGRCCGRKPWIGRRERKLFCGRCYAAYTLEGKQVENFHYARTIGGWIRFLHHACGHDKPPAPVA